MRTLVLEFNELSPTLLDRFIAAGHLPNFARLRDASLVAVTDAEEQAPLLEPWIQWVTVHTGLSFDRHKCFQLNDGAGLEAPRIWDLVSRAGKSNWICGSMNGGAQVGFRGHLLPDPWASEVAAQPPGFFDAYAALVGAYVKEHSGRPAVTKGDFIRFGRFMIAQGLSAASVFAALRQLASERTGNAKWRRAMILDRLQWDLFRSVYKSARPDFATFFLNSTAHFQHFHWREMEPELFAVRSAEPEQRAFASAILDGYRNMDRIVGQALGLAGSDTSVVLLTALSQQPMLTHEEHGGRQIFRQRDISQLLEFAGVAPGWDYAPIMSQQFLLSFADEAAAQQAADRIESLRLSDSRQPMWARREGSRLDCGCMIDQAPADSVTVTSPASNRTPAFGELFYPLEALRSGMHHPDGVFWISGPGVRAGRVPGRISLRQVAPTLAALCGVAGDFELAAMPLAGEPAASVTA